jgi:uncharacterized caspase-like protein
MEWVEAGGYLTGDWSIQQLQEERGRRQRQWYWMLTRLAKIVTKAVAKFCQLIQDQVAQSHLLRHQMNAERTAEEQEHGFSLFLSKAKQQQEQHSGNDGQLPLHSTKSMPESMDQLRAQLAVQQTIQTCVRINNIEAARQQLSDFYDELEVKEIVEFLHKNLQ